MKIKNGNYGGHANVIFPCGCENNIFYVGNIDTDLNLTLKDIILKTTYEFNPLCPTCGEKLEREDTFFV